MPVECAERWWDFLSKKWIDALKALLKEEIAVVGKTTCILIFVGKDVENPFKTISLNMTRKFPLS